MIKKLEINSIRLEKLNNDEFAQFIKVTLNLVQDVTLEKIGIQKELYESLQKRLDDLTEATRQSRQNAETHKIADLDKVRGKLVVFLLSSFRNERGNVVAKNRKEAASALYSLTKNFSGIQSLPLRQKTHTINALLKDLQKPENQKHIETLGLSDSVSTLLDYNQQCENLIQGRADSQLSVVKISSRIPRKEATELYRWLIKYAYATYLLHQNEENTSFIVRLNKLIVDTTLANKQRLA